MKWQAALVALFACLPVAAVPGILFQQQGWPTLLKDALFLLPGYVGMTAAVAGNRTFRWPLPPLLTIPLFGLIVVVLLQALRVMPTYALVALIGLKTWLLYIPLLLVPVAIFRSVAGVWRFIRMLVVVSVIPGVVAVVEFTLVATGHKDIAYQWYGGLVSGVTQDFAQVGLSDQISVGRIPSTFTSFTQFVAYCLVTTPFCVVTWMADPDVRWRRFAAAASMLIIAAGFASGSRTFYVWGPIEIALMVLFIKRNRIQVASMMAVVGTVSVIALGSQLAQVFTFITTLGWDYLVKLQAAEFPAVYQIAGLFGIGAGLDTNASRYVLPSQALPYDIQGWYALTFLELGLPGLILVVFIWSVLLGRAWFGVRLTSGAATGPIARCAFVILLTTIPSLYKGASLEYDPLNVYFWFVAGLSLAVPRLTVNADDQREVRELGSRMRASVVRRNS